MEENILVKVGADIGDFASAITKATQQLEKFADTIASAMDKASKETEKAEQRVKTFSERMTETGRQLRDVGGGIAASFGAMAAGITIPLKKAVNTSVDFDTAMRKAATIAGATEEEFDALKRTALELGAATTKSAQEVAIAMAEMAAKGYEVNDIIASMPGVIAASEASGESLALTADTVASAINAFGLEASEASRVADILAESANASAAGIIDLQYAFKYAASPAAQLGYSLETLAAATGIMVDAGLEGSQAGTTLRAALVRLVKPPKQAAEALATLGIEVTDQNGNMKSLSQIIGELSAAMSDYTDAEKSAALAAIFGTEAVTGMMALMAAGPEKIDAMTKSLENSAGASEEAAKKMMGGLGGTLEEMSGAFETARIIIGDHLAPALQKAAQRVTALVEKFNKADPRIQKIIVTVAAVAASVLGFIATIGAATAAVGLFMLSVAPVVGLFKRTGTAGKATGGIIARLGKAFRLLFSPMSLVVGVAAALIGGFVHLYKNSESFRNSIDNLTATLQSGFLSLLERVKSIFQQLSASIGPKLAPIIERLAGAFKSLMAEIGKIFSGDFSGIIGIFEQIGPSIVAALIGGIPALIITAARYLPAIAEGIENNLPTIIEVVIKVINTIISGITTALPMVVEVGMQLIQKLIEGLTVALPILLYGITTLLMNLITFFLEQMPLIIELGVSILQNLIDGLISAIPILIESVTTIATEFVNAITSHLPTILDTGIQILTTLIDGILAILPELAQAAITLIMTVVLTIIDNLPKIIEAGVKILISLIQGIIKTLPQLIQLALRLIISLVSALISNLPQIITAGGKILLALIKGVFQLVPELIKLGFTLVKELAGAIIGAIPEMFKVGADLIKGLWNGIKSVGGWIKDKIKGFFGGIVGGIKKFFGISSPSKLFRDDIGRWLPAGMIDGITAMKNDVISAAQDLTKWATPEPPDVSLAYATPNGTYGTLSSAVRGTVDVNSRDELLAAAVEQLARKLDGLTVEMDGRTVGKIVAPTVSREIYNESTNARWR